MEGWTIFDWAWLGFYFVIWVAIVHFYGNRR
jgi:hypothetical protein